MRLLITGGTGFIGSHLILAAAAQNIEVVCLSRSGLRPEGAKSAFKWKLGEQVPEKAYEDVDCVVYLAHDFNSVEGARLTIDSTLSIASQLENAGIKRQLFFSSYSAGKHASSLYGQTKFSLEEALSNHRGLVIIRPGLVLGNGGIYGRICTWARRLPFVPLPDGGEGKVPVIEIEKLCDITIKLALASSPPTEANIFEPELKSLRELVLDAAAEVGRHPWILPIPATFLIGILKLAGQIHLPIPVNADNLAGFLANQSAQHIPTFIKNEQE